MLIITIKIVLKKLCLVIVRNRKAVFRILNPTDKLVFLKSNKIVANVTQIEPKSVLSLEGLNEECENENTIGLSNLQNKTNKTSPKHTFDLSDSDLSAKQKERLLHLLKKNEDVFSEGLHDLGCTNLQTHRIETSDAAPVRLPPYKQNLHVREANGFKRC